MNKSQIWTSRYDAVIRGGATIKIIVAGSRSFNDYDFLEKKLDYFCQRLKSVEIISGAARGADQLGEQYAAKRGYPIKRFPADWDAFGKSAGYKRNEEMAKYAEAAVIFWDGESKGSKHMIDLATKMGLKVRIVKYKE